jgi:hypothetical protein
MSGIRNFAPEAGTHGYPTEQADRGRPAQVYKHFATLLASQDEVRPLNFVRSRDRFRIGWCHGQDLWCGLSLEKENFLFDMKTGALY